MPVSLQTIYHGSNPDSGSGHVSGYIQGEVESFVAAFMLGMKKKFGNIDHLGATVSQEPVPDADYRNQYLVIYDTVPGGTGYLRQLMNDRHGMINVMQLAVEAMEKCTCREEKNKDGCYKMPVCLQAEPAYR